MQAQPISLQSAIDRTRDANATWWTRARADAGWLLAIPDVSLTCEVLLADRLFHDLDLEEQDSMLAWVRAQQHESGAWLDVDGRADLSATALAWWAMVQAGDDPESEPLVTALRAVHELGGAQRAAFNVRLWLAMAGLVPWDWLPSIPSEMWLLPSSVALSPSRISTWARGILTPYHVLAAAPARLQLADASALLLRGKDGNVIPPRLTSPGLAGDLLQAFDRAIKISRKFPRGPVKQMGFDRARAWIDEAHQDHGGWFSARPTLLSLLALRVAGATSDDPRVRQGLDYLRRARGTVGTNGRRHVAQGMSALPLGLGGSLAQAAGIDATAWLLAAQIRGPGPWQRRAPAPAGGWPSESGAQLHVDLYNTCLVIDALRAPPSEGDDAEAAARVSRSLRRAAEVILAMQEPDGGFARFERGESEVLLASFPWRDADQLNAMDPRDPQRVELSAMALRQLASLGHHREDDRIRRGVRWLADMAHADARTWSVATLAQVARCAAAHCEPTDPLRRLVDTRLRGRQHEDGSFGGPVETAAAIVAMIELDGVCVQATRAARHLAQAVADTEDLVHLGARVMPGLGLSPGAIDPSAGVRLTHMALARFRDAGGTL